jgi:hypothetical protein
MQKLRWVPARLKEHHMIRRLFRRNVSLAELLAPYVRSEPNPRTGDGAGQASFSPLLPVPPYNWGERS